MKDSNKKIFFFLGLGIGIIVVNLIYQFNPKVKQEEISDDVIIERAEELGMVSVKESITLEKEREEEKKKQEEEAKKIKEIEEKIEKKKKEETQEEKKEETDKEKIYTLIIESGDTVSDISKKLLEKGLIEEREVFSKKVDELDAAKVMRTGEHEISTEDSIEDIIGKIANIR